MRNESTPGTSLGIQRQLTAASLSSSELLVPHHVCSKVLNSCADFIFLFCDFIGKTFAAQD